MCLPDLVRKVQQIVTEHGAGCSCTGHILEASDDTPASCRVVVGGDRAVAIRPRIVWPDGSEGLD